MSRENSYATLDADGQVPVTQLDNAAGGGPHTHSGADIDSGTVADARVASTLARDTEVTAAVTAHEALADPHTGYVKEADANWVDLTDGGATTLHSHAGAPADADYLVGTAHAGLSAEIVVGATPGGELGNTWASPTVDATHSGSTHAAAQAAAEATAAAALSGHAADTTAIHGIADASALSLTSHDHDADYEASGGIATHSAATTSVHGIADTSVLATATDVSGAVSTHAGLADPHTGYRLESADHTHASTGLQAGTVAHTALTSVGANDHHAQLHAAAHATGQPDVIAPADIGASATGHTHTHAATTGQGVDDHHARDHAINGATHTGTLDDAQIPAGITRDAEAAAAYQPLDSDLTAIAALTTTAFGRGLLALADAAALSAAHTHSGASTLYAPGSFAVATGNYAVMVKTLQLTTTQRVTLAGTARLRIT